MIDLWLNCQTADDYNPTHTHGGSFSEVIFLKVPLQINANNFDGQLCFHAPETGTFSRSAPAWRTTCCLFPVSSICSRPGNPIR